MILSTAVFGQGSNFLPPTDYAVPGQGGIAVGDFNGDKIPDVVVANGDSTVSILLGNGDGTFQAQYTVTAVPSSSSYVTQYVAVGDFNGDGYPDLAILCVSSFFDDFSSTATGSINILLNKADGTGTFGGPTVIPLQGSGPLVVQAAHFGTDANFDLAVVNSGSNSVSIFLGNGNGTFQTEVDYALDFPPAAMAIGDLNNDGYVDLAVAGGGAGANPNGFVGILLGTANGAFRTAVDWPTETAADCEGQCRPPLAVAIGDFNGDSKLDLAVNNGFGNPDMIVLLGNGDGTFETPIGPFPSAEGGCVASWVTATDADFNSDGRLDLATAVGCGEAAAVLLGKGDGTFPSTYAGSLSPYGTGVSARQNAATAPGGIIAAADFNGDGFPDLAVATYLVGTQQYSVTVLLNCGLKCDGVTLSSSAPNYSSFNQAVTLTAIVTPANAKATATPTGSVVFEDTTQSPATVLGTIALSGEQAALTISTLAIGSHTIVASYQGDANYIAAISAALTQVVNPASTTISISSSVDPSTPGQSITFTATVTPSTSGMPTGTVNFSNNGTLLFYAVVGSAGTATYTTSSLSAGTYLMTGSYSGDSNYEDSDSSVLVQIVNTNTAPFSLYPPTTTASVSPGQAAGFGIWIYSVPSFKSPITFSCSGLPAGSSCNFGTNPITPTSNQMAISLYVTTTASQASLQPLSNSPTTAWPDMILGTLALAVLSLWAGGKRLRERFVLTGLGLACAGILLVAAIGCGGSGSSSGGGGGTPSHTPTPSGTYQITVTGTSGSATQSFTVTVTVT